MKRILSVSSGLVLLCYIVLENNNYYNKSMSNRSLYFKMPLILFLQIWSTQGFEGHFYKAKQGHQKEKQNI